MVGNGKWVCLLLVEVHGPSYPKTEYFGVGCSQRERKKISSFANMGESVGNFANCVFSPICNKVSKIILRFWQIEHCYFKSLSTFSL
jgi:hypothetical protein